MKTILTRMQRVGEGTDPETFKKIEKSLHSLGIEMKSSGDTIRPSMDILGDLAGKWETLTDVQQHSIAEQAAGGNKRPTIWRHMVVKLAISVALKSYNANQLCRVA